MDFLTLTHSAVALLVIALAVPLILGKVPMNHWYGVRIPESFKSDERWFEINRFGGWMLLGWGVLILITSNLLAWAGAENRWIGTAVIVGGVAAVVIATLRHASRTKSGSGT